MTSPPIARGQPGDAADAAALASTVAVACVAVFTSYLQISSVAVTLAAMGRDLHASASDLQWVYDAFTVPVAALILSAGVIGDVLGRKRVTIVGLVLVTAGSLTSFCAPSVQVVWAGRAVAGIGSAGLLPATLALISHAVPEPGRRSRHVAMWATSLNLALAAGPFMAGSILTVAGWRWIFLPMAVIAAITAAVAALVLEDSRAPGQRRLDWPGQATAAAAVGGLAYGVIEGGRSGWTSPDVLAALSAAAAALAVFAGIEARSASPMLHLGLFRSRAFSAAVFAGFMAMFSLIGVNFVLSLFLGGTQHRTPLGIAVVLLCLYGTTTVTGRMAGTIIARTGPNPPLIIGLLCCAAGMLTLSRADPDITLSGLAPPLVITGAGFGLVLTSVTSAAVNAVPHHLAGMAAAAINAFRQVGGALGAAVLGVAFTAGTAASLKASLATVHIGPSTISALLSTIPRNGAVPSGTPPSIARAASAATAAGLHPAVAIAATGMLAAAIISAVLNQTAARSKAVPPSPDPPAEQAGKAEVMTDTDPSS